MKKHDECKLFSGRLRQALKDAGLRGDSPTDLQRRLSVVGIDVTVHAARKWLLGEAIPTQDKLTKMADWLGKAPHWLRFGVGDGSSTASAGQPIAPRTLRVMHDFEQLTPRDQIVVQVVIDRMLQNAA